MLQKCLTTTITNLFDVTILAQKSFSKTRIIFSYKIIKCHKIRILLQIPKPVCQFLVNPLSVTYPINCDILSSQAIEGGFSYVIVQQTPRDSIRNPALLNRKEVPLTCS